MTQAVARLRLLTGDLDDLMSLRAWLTDEDELRGAVLVEHDSSQVGQMGTLADVLVIALGAGGAATALARSVPTWLRRNAHVTVEIRDATGRTIKVSAKGNVNPQDVIQSALAVPEDL